MNWKIVLTLVSILLFANFASAQAVTGGTTVAGGTQSWSGTSSTSVNILGGNITEVNVSGYSQTGRWAGFWGEVSGGLKLSDSTNSFYEWTVSDVTGAVVYAADAAVSNWGSVAAAGTLDMPGYLTAGATDNFTNTFNTTGKTFTSTSLSVGSAPYTNTYSSGAAGNLETYALKDGATLIWAGKALSNEASFNGGTVDYQLLVPANGTQETYNFYLELP